VSLSLNFNFRPPQKKPCSLVAKGLERTAVYYTHLAASHWYEKADLMMADEERMTKDIQELQNHEDMPTLHYRDSKQLMQMFKKC
jgi:hypothetical protein